MRMMAAPKMILTMRPSMLLSISALGMLPASISAISGPKTFGSRLFRFCHVKMALPGKPSASSTGEMLALLTPKLKML